MRFSGHGGSAHKKSKLKWSHADFRKLWCLYHIFITACLLFVWWSQDSEENERTDVFDRGLYLPAQSKSWAWCLKVQCKGVTQQSQRFSWPHFHGCCVLQIINSVAWVSRGSEKNQTSSHTQKCLAGYLTRSCGESSETMGCLLSCIPSGFFSDMLR